MNGMQLVQIDPAGIYAKLIGGLEKQLKEPLFDGDERRLFAEAQAPVFVALYNTINDAARQTMLTYARGDVLDALGERTDTHRIASEKARVQLLFTKSEAARGQSVIIPSGVRITPDGLRYFATNAMVTIPASEQTAEVIAISAEGGAQYNDIPMHSMSTMSDRIPYISGVTNTTISEGGKDGEPYTEEGDNLYRERIRLSINKFTTAGPQDAYAYHALSADAEIISVSITSPAPGEVLIVPMLAEGKIPGDDLLAKVLEACNDRKIRPLTDYVHVAAPEAVPYTVDIVCYITQEDMARKVADIEQAAQEYAAWQSGALGRDINPDMLRKYAMDAGAYRLDIAAPDYQELRAVDIAALEGMPRIIYEAVAE